MCSTRVPNPFRDLTKTNFTKEGGLFSGFLRRVTEFALKLHHIYAIQRSHMYVSHAITNATLRDMYVQEGNLRKLKTSQSKREQTHLFWGILMALILTSTIERNFLLGQDFWHEIAF